MINEAQQEAHAGSQSDSVGVLPRPGCRSRRRWRACILIWASLAPRWERCRDCPPGCGTNSWRGQTARAKRKRQESWAAAHTEAQEVIASRLLLEELCTAAVPGLFTVGRVGRTGFGPGTPVMHVAPPRPRIPVRGGLARALHANRNLCYELWRFEFNLMRC